jgi:outer membrane protein assembly factor BamE (lipoprotein component of BamABCDE complex)
MRKFIIAGMHCGLCFAVTPTTSWSQPSGCLTIQAPVDKGQEPVYRAHVPDTELPKWRQIHKNMTMDDVRAILGEPCRVAVHSDEENWFYSNLGSFGPYVMFNPDSRRVGHLRE